MSQDSAATRFPVQAVRGVKDVLPEESPAWQHLEAVCRELFGQYGFREIRVPIFEVTPLFARAVGEATDIVEKEMYTFEDKGGNSLTLRPEGTAGVIRAYIQSALQREALTRIYYMGPMFRHERPQAGRLRQFHQIGLEALGPEVPAVDAEVITLLADLFDRLGIKGLALELNSIGCADCRPAYTDDLKARLAALSDRLCDNCNLRRETNPLRVLDCKVPECGEATSDMPAITDCLCEACETHFTEVKERLEAADVAFTVNPRMVRGLDYYTRTAFEFISCELGAQSTVAAGGRYDRLVEQLGGQHKPGIGFALGVERLLLLMPEVAPPRPDLFAVLVGEDADRRMLPLLRQLRQAGISVDRAFGGSMKSQMKRADKSNARLCLIVAEDELARDVVTLRDMDTRDQQDAPMADLLETVRQHLG
ncbi:MAG: histidine--tRNA ligase [Leptospirillia bacterium]